MASYVRNIRTKNYRNLIIGFKVTVENVADAFMRHSNSNIPGNIPGVATPDLKE